MPRTGLWILGTFFLATQLPSSSASQEVETSELRLTVMVVSDALEVKPVPKWRFEILDSQGDVVTSLTTGFDGKAQTRIEPGEYTIRSEAPLPYEGETLSWDVAFRVELGTTTDIELSNDNARIEVDAKRASEVEMDEGDLYNRVQKSVFKVLSESGHGSGFLVRDTGLVVTNHHVVAGSDYLAVTVDHNRKYPARLVAADDLNDIAILQIHPSATEGLKPVPLAQDEPATPPCSVGERVVAIGSPLATETILTSGLVSKIEEDAIYSDVSINPGNSGGPLFNLRGEVIGVNTFGLVTQSGPGVAGILRIHLAERLLREITPGDLSEPPSAVSLPVASDFRFPPEHLREQALSREISPKEYHLEAGKFDVQFLTPIVIADLEVQAEEEAARFREKRSKKKAKKGGIKEYQAGRDFYEWRKYGGDYRAVVTIQAVPEIRMTTGSAFAVAMLGASAPQKYRFKADFDRMELDRGGVVVQPIHPRRLTNVVNMAQGQVSMQDVGFYGSYEYPPEAFKPGADLTLRVWKQGDADPIVKPISLAQQERLWRDFESYFEALEEAAGRE